MQPSSLDMVPRYYRIYEELYNEIKNGVYQEGDRFPSDTNLVQKYHVSRGTIREAIKMLFQQGLLVREQGRGTFVTYRKIKQDAHQLMGFTELMQHHGKKASGRILDISTIQPDERIRAILQLQHGDKVVKIKRLRLGDKEPLIIEHSFYVHDLFEPLLAFDLETESIYELLYRETNIRLGTATHQIEATTADSQAAAHLNIKPEAPLLLMKRLIQTREQRYFQYSEDLYRADQLSFTISTIAYDENHNEMGNPLTLNTI